MHFTGTGGVAKTSGYARSNFKKRGNAIIFRILFKTNNKNEYIHFRAKVNKLICMQK